MISVIILSYNTKELTQRCLEALSKSIDVDLEIIVVDNNSSDGSQDLISKKFPKVKLIENSTNVGFAAGNNQAMKIAKGDLFLLLNSDCFVEPTTIKILSERIAISDWGVVGCKLLNGDGSIQPSFGYFPTLRRIFSLMTFIDNFPLIRQVSDSIHVRDVSRYTKTQEIDWITGALVMLKKEVYVQTGGIDEKYFMYGEEMEWMYRAKQHGYKIGYVAEAQATHLQGSSTKSKSKMFLSEMQGFIYWYSKHNSKIEQFLLRLFIISGCVIRIPAWAVWGKWDLVKAYLEVLPKLFTA